MMMEYVHLWLHVIHSDVAIAGVSIIGVVVGAVMTHVFGDWRERDARRKDRQYDTIIEAQDLIGQLLGLEGDFVRNSLRHFNDTNKWPTFLDADRSVEVQRTNLTLRLTALRFRIEDQQLEAALDKAQARAAELSRVIANGEVDSIETAMEAAAGAVARFHERVGVVLPELH